MAVSNDGQLSVTVANLSSSVKRIRKGAIVGTISELRTEEYNCIEVFDGAYDPYTEPVAETVVEVNAASMTAREMKDIRTKANWKDIPADLHIGEGQSGLTDDQFDKLLDFIRIQYKRGMFSTNTNPGQVHANIAEHTIETGDAKPISFAPRRTAPAKRAIIAEHTQKMRDSGVIRPSRSPWAAPVVLAPKKDGTWRFCIDYRELNKVTTKDVYPLPRIDDTVDALNGARFLSAFDMLAGYWQVGLDRKSALKTAFVTHEGLFEWTCMPFGLSGAPATFQRMMDTIEICNLYSIDSRTLV